MVSRETSGMATPPLIEEVTRVLVALGIDGDARQSMLLASHIEWLLATNSELNLTAIETPSEAVTLHLADSLLGMTELSDAPRGPLCDIGTGGGFPGYPLAVMSGRRGVLVDSVSKKARALAAFIEAVGLSEQLAVKPIRSEQLAQEQSGEFAVVVARAVATLPVLVELAAPLLCRGGRFIAFKGVPAQDEVAAGASAAALCGLTPLQSRQAMVPGTELVRTIVTYQKTGAPSIALPRRPGMAKKRPLA